MKINSNFNSFNKQALLLFRHNLHTSTCDELSDIKKLIMYNKNTQILNNLVSKFLSRIKDKDLEKDIYSLLYNNKLLNKKVLLNKYPELIFIEMDLTNDFKYNTVALRAPK